MVLILPPNRPLYFCVFIWGQESAPDSVGLRSVPAAHHLYLWWSKSVVEMLREPIKNVLAEFVR